MSGSLLQNAEQDKTMHGAQKGKADYGLPHGGSTFTTSGTADLLSINIWNCNAAMLSKGSTVIGAASADLLPINTRKCNAALLANPKP